MENKDLYIEELETALINSLDKLSRCSDNFDYYDTLSEITNWNNSRVLDFLDKFGDDE